MLLAALAALPTTLPASALDADLPRDRDLEQSLSRTLDEMNLKGAVDSRHMAVSLVDVTDASRPRYAGVNDQHMMYAASLPKIAVLVAAFERIRAGLLDYTPALRDTLTRMTRFSSNVDASRAIQSVGFGYIADVLTSAKYRFYDMAQNGGLWIGKAYGGPNDYWKRDPLHNLSHGATSIQVARFFVLMEQGKLVDAQSSAEIKEILSKPGIHHKFVKGLDAVPGCKVFRKSGTWANWHSDAALVEHNGKKYVAVALMEDPKGGEVLPKLIVKLDELICGGNGLIAAVR